MTRTLVTGATGRLGSAVCPRLAAAGHEVVAASRSPPEDAESDPGDDGVTEWVELDLADGTGVETAVAGVDVVVHAASAQTGDTEAVDVAGTERLARAAADAGVENLVYPSIVGVDEIPYAYYEAKLAAEKRLGDSDVDATIIRATQFHSFVHWLVDTAATLPVWFLPTAFRVQPVAATEVADAVVERATPEASGRVDPVGGPEVLSLGEMARAYRDARGLWRPIVRVPVPGSVAAGYRAGHNTCPDRAVGTVTWEAWLAERYGGPTSADETAVGSPS
jgi:uncharacterized protein YbjT (DUF2867 family)